MESFKMIKDWDVARIKSEIDRIWLSESDPHNDGFVGWGCKKDLYKVLWHCQEVLEKCSTYEGEEEYVKKHKVKKMIEVLKK